jgi:hypothetical protein
MISLKRGNLMEKKKAVAYWNVYDSGTGAALEKEKVIDRNPMPSAGGLIIGITGKPNAIVRDFKFSGTKDGLPCYDVYV